jgi:hypothetical protein
MLPGPTIIYKCPNCENFIKNNSLMSFNTIGAIRFSDNKIIGLLMVELPDITKCKKCNTIFWLEGEYEIGSYDLWDKSTVETEWRNADQAEFLTIEDYFVALELEEITRSEEDEFYIRQNIWWEYNDRVRWKGKEQFKNNNDQILWKSNLDRFVELLDESDINQLIMRAEIYRNLGDFEKCMSIIQGITEAGFENIKDAFEKACKEKNTKVFEFKQSKKMKFSSEVKNYIK